MIRSLSVSSVLLLLLVVCLVEVDAARGTSPACTSGCPNCQEQPSLAGGSSVNVKSLTCNPGKTVVVRSVAFTPICSTPNLCSNVKLTITTPTQTYPSDSNNCFRQTVPLVLTNAGAAVTSATATVICTGSATCYYASFIDMFCQDFIPGHAASVITAAGASQIWNSGNPTCACGNDCVSNSASTGIPGGQYFTAQTNGGVNCPYPAVYRFSVQATDATSTFRVYAKKTKDVLNGTPYYPLGSSSQLTGGSVSCFSTTFGTGATNALVGESNSVINLIALCTSATCNLKYYADGGCSNTASAPTEYTLSIDACGNTCGNFGTCSSGGTCTCDTTTGYTGTYCDQPPVALAFASGCDASVSCGAGTCSANRGCVCPTGYSGTNCQITPKTYNPAVWIGSYRLSGCDASQCCCYTTVRISASGTRYLIDGPVSGAACASNVATVTVPINVPTSDTITYSMLTFNHEMTRNAATSSVRDTNTGAGSCSATWTKTSAATASFSTSIVMIIALALAAVASMRN